MEVEVGEEVDPVEEDLEEVVDVEGLGEVVAVDLLVEVVGAVAVVVEVAAVAVVVALQFEPMDVVAEAVEVDFEEVVQGLVHRDKAEAESCTSSMLSNFFFLFFRGEFLQMSVSGGSSSYSRYGELESFRESSEFRYLGTDSTV